MDGDPGLVADGPSTRLSGIAVDVRLFHESRCRLVHKYRELQGPISISGAPGGGGGGSASPIVIICDPRYGCRAADKSAHIDSGVGSAPRGGARGVLSARRVHAFPGDDGPLSCIIRQSVTVLGDYPLLEQSLDIRIHAPVCPDVAEDNDIDSVDAVLDVPVPVLRLPPGFEKFVVGGFPKAWRGSSGNFRVPEGVEQLRRRVCQRCCVEESASAVAQKSLPARLRGRVRKRLLDLVYCNNEYTYSIANAGISAASQGAFSICIPLGDCVIIVYNHCWY